MRTSIDFKSIASEREFTFKDLVIQCLRLNVMYERSSMIKRAALLIPCSMRRSWYLSWASANFIARGGAVICRPGGHPYRQQHLNR
ncbi:IstB-like ATP-binding protein [Thermacetogenium phaeum DSM 12270]|uniref:IstB-like ATP-binding protein n=1 Tax=Thermacetogenium phaeum (strain ATCC BAA-254 / DSM 26808 / PB) TaxID=1089553 RepID=K4LE52_THEPS|nr:IstB-like ATP-binding protein [Thermacetogenium phaeum DSM 12270]